MGERKKLRIIFIVLLIAFISTMTPVTKTKQEVSAASKYIKVDDFVEHLVRQANLPVDKTSKRPYIDAAIDVGILKKEDFKDYNVYLSRGDCAVLANRLDEYLYGEYYGYTEELYKFLKGCEYYKGRLCYDLEGELYPAGVERRTYYASTFLKEIIIPIISSSFNFDKELNAEYKTLYDDNGNALRRYVEIAYMKESPALRIGTDPMEDDHPIIKTWKRIIDEDRKLQAVYDKRISDIDKVAEEKRMDIAKIVSKGIIKGFNNGMYVQNREFRADKKITAKGAKNVISMVLNPKDRSLISPDGQLIRTSKLPKNADKYPYILACFPNEFYEMPLRFERFDTSVYDKCDIKYPLETGNKAIEIMYVNFILLGMEPYEYYDTIMKQVEQYVENVLNVDYRTVDEKWKTRVESSYYPFTGYTVNEMIDDYLKVMKKNRVIVESKLISVEPSAMYYFDGSFYVRVYAKYRVTADTLDVKEDHELVFGDWAVTNLIGLKNNEWTYGYYDIQISSSNIDPVTYDRYQSYMYFGIDAWAGLNDYPLKESN